jgi:NAD(P)-dependent dehydrogenase (short-subunit alcohol dehydrogenase family)
MARRGSLQMDVTNKESILAVKKLIEEKEGKLHILVNKSVVLSIGDTNGD